MRNQIPKTSFSVGARRKNASLKGVDAICGINITNKTRNGASWESNDEGKRRVAKIQNENIRRKNDFF